MRNFCSVVPRINTLGFRAGADSKQVFDCLSTILHYMEVELPQNHSFSSQSLESWCKKSLTPSELNVIHEFLRWASEFDSRIREDKLPDNSSFIYTNMNTGKTVVFVGLETREHGDDLVYLTHPGWRANYLPSVLVPKA